MKYKICDVCEKRTPVTDLQCGRYCALVVCGPCRRENSENGQDEEWTPLEKNFRSALDK
jgi:hypothetical protein